MSSLIDNPKIAKRLVEATLDGVTQRELAAEYGVSQRTIGRALETNQIKQLLQKSYEEIAQLSPHVVDFYREEITRTGTIDIPLTLDDRKIKLSVAKEITAASGLSPVRDSHNNLFFTQIVAPTQITINPTIEKLLDRLVDSDETLNGGEPEWVDIESE
jgi:DNA-binding XRE family transcriptional regulator